MARYGDLIFICHHHTIVIMPRAMLIVQRHRHSSQTTRTQTAETSTTNHHYIYTQAAANPNVFVDIGQQLKTLQFLRVLSLIISTFIRYCTVNVRQTVQLLQKFCHSWQRSNKWWAWFFIRPTKQYPSKLWLFFFPFSFSLSFSLSVSCLLCVWIFQRNQSNIHFTQIPSEFPFLQQSSSDSVLAKWTSKHKKTKNGFLAFRLCSTYRFKRTFLTFIFVIIKSIRKLCVCV